MDVVGRSPLQRGGAFIAGVQRLSGRLLELKTSGLDERGQKVVQAGLRQGYRLVAVREAFQGERTRKATVKFVGSREDVVLDGARLGGADALSEGCEVQPGQVADGTR